MFNRSERLAEIASAGLALQAALFGVKLQICSLPARRFAG